MISIIIPIYNTEPYLAKCLDSCFAQTYSDIEVLAINDGSDDRSGELLDNYTKNEPRLRVFHQENGGVVAARNKGIECARGEWLMFVDSDDAITPNAIELLLGQITDQTDIVVGHYQKYFPALDYYRQSPFDYPTTMSSTNFIELILLKKIQWGLWAKLYRRSLFQNLQPTKFKLGEDACTLVQAAYKARQIALLPTVIYTYSQRCDSATHRPGNNTPDIYSSRRWIVNYLNQNGYKHTSDCNYFIVDGYLEYLLAGERQELSTKTIRSEIYALSKKASKSFTLWQRLLLWADIYHLAGPMGKLLKLLQKTKFQIIYLLNKSETIEK